MFGKYFEGQEISVKVSVMRSAMLGTYRTVEETGEISFEELFDLWNQNLEKNEKGLSNEELDWIMKENEKMLSVFGGSL